jgi:hypothetical protein
MLDGGSGVEPEPRLKTWLVTDLATSAPNTCCDVAGAAAIGVLMLRGNAASEHADPIKRPAPGGSKGPSPVRLTPGMLVRCRRWSG